MKIKNQRLYSLLPVIFIAILLVYALFAEYYLYLAPCPLCMVQRYIYVAIGFLFLLSFIFNPQRIMKKVISLFIFLFTALGIGVTGRHVWLTTLPPEEVPDCGPGLDYMLDAFPLGDVFKELFYGAGECAETVWQLLGLNMPSWSLICFIALFFYTIFWTFKKQSRFS